MANRDDDEAGGPAFPSQPMGMDGVPAAELSPGMTLRDWFAGQALAGMGTWAPGFGRDGRPPITSDNIRAAKARWAYYQADAMLEERNR